LLSAVVAVVVQKITSVELADSVAVDEVEATLVAFKRNQEQ
jgi:hypothetical protein